MVSRPLFQRRFQKPCFARLVFTVCGIDSRIRFPARLPANGTGVHGYRFQVWINSVAFPNGRMWIQAVCTRSFRGQPFQFPISKVLVTGLSARVGVLGRALLEGHHSHITIDLGLGASSTMDYQHHLFYRLFLHGPIWS